MMLSKMAGRIIPVVIFSGAMVAGGCAKNATQISPRSTNEAPHSSATPIPTVLAAPDIFTPQKALRDALSEPLRFIGRDKADDIGVIDYFCLWRNSKVLVRTDYCGPADDTTGGERQGDEGVSVYIYSPEGNEVYISAGVDEGKSAYRAKRNEYAIFQVWYRKLSRESMPSLSIRQYIDFFKTTMSPSCKNDSCCAEASKEVVEKEGEALVHRFVGAGYIKCDKGIDSATASAWEKAGTEFYKNPPQEWFNFLTTLKSLLIKHRLK